MVRIAVGDVDGDREIETAGLFEGGVEVGVRQAAVAFRLMDTPEFYQPIAPGSKERGRLVVTFHM